MPIKGNYIFFLISIILSIVFINTKAIATLIIFLILLLFLMISYNPKFAFINLGLFLFFSFYKVNDKPILVEGNVTLECKVVEVKESYLIIKDSNASYIVYIDDNIYTKKDTILVTGNLKSLDNDLEIDVFDFTSYLNKKRVFYQIDKPDIEIKNKGKHLPSMITNFLTRKLINSSYSMTKMLLFNDKNADIDTYNNLKDINAIHMFVVSGFHISFFFSLISKLFKSKEKLGNLIGLLLCFIYVFILDFSLSATRALLSLFIVKLLDRYFSRLDSIAIPGIIFLIIEPLNVFNYSFILTFIMSFTIAFSSPFLARYNKVTKSLLQSIICFIAMIPIQLLLNYKVNVISLFTNILLTYAVTVIFVLTLIGMVFSFAYGDIFGFIYNLFDNLVYKLASINTSITMGSLKMYQICIYYTLFILLLIAFDKKAFNKVIKRFSYIFIFLVALYNRNLINPIPKVSFLNVYQGDCTIIQDSFSNKVMLIDTGGLANYDIATKKIMPYLNYHGIRKIDSVVITHSDYDHCGALDVLKESIPIKNIYYELDSISLGKITLTNLNHYYDSNSEINDTSLILYGKIGSLNYMFTGDATTNIEKNIVLDYDYLPVDVLKVGHHGSNSSTSNDFINLINPKYAIISVGANNHYGHPNSEVLETLENYKVKVYRTDLNGTIRINGKICGFYYIESAK